MFEMSMADQVGKFVNFNLRPEKHGDSNVPGADLKISFTSSNTMLADLHPSLKTFLFRAPEPGEMDMVDQASDGELPLNRLRFGSSVKSIRWNHEIVGAKFVVHYGTGGKSNITLDETTIDGFVIEPMDGGSVVITFRVKCNPDETSIAKLATLMGGEIEFSMTPPHDSLQEAA